MTHAAVGDTPGGLNFASDREAAGHVLRMAPWVRQATHHNRAFLRRAVTYLVEEAGVRQFLDIGSGLPTVGNVHEVAQEPAPECRVAYVDNDPIVVAHSAGVLAGNELTMIIEADLRQPDAVIGHPRVRRLLNYDEPIGLLMVSVLLFIEDRDHPDDLVAEYIEHLA